MRPRLLTHRILFLRPFRPPNSPRPFTHNTLDGRARPQLPFLSPSTFRRPKVRFLSTETKQWIKSEFWRGTRWTLYLWSFAGLGVVLIFGVQQEWLERKYPTPAEWSWEARRQLRGVLWDEELGEENPIYLDWARSGATYRRILGRLEDPNVDGAGVEEQEEGGILVAGIGKTGFDISKKSEPWRRGYYETLMGAARAAEHLDDWVKDRTRNIAFPANVVIGPSNPNPRPCPPGTHSAPREEDCDDAFESPEVYYVRALTTKGFTVKQRMDAALAYGVWLDYKKTPDAALEMYKWALDIATADAPPSIIDTKTGILNPNAGLPSANLLSATTALAIHHASNSNLKDALPIFLSVLRARRSLPTSPATMRATLVPDQDENTKWQAFSRLLESAVVPPTYPPPQSDGTTPPERNAKERCEEAGIMSYIGEILYASKSGKTNKEDGLAWTREAVDIAEEELRGKGIDKEAAKTCKQCLSVGLDNWATMVAQMAKAERMAKASGTEKKGGSWFWGGEDMKVVGRWESEEQVVSDRMVRAKEILGTSLR